MPVGRIETLLKAGGAPKRRRAAALHGAAGASECICSALCSSLHHEFVVVHQGADEHGGGCEVGGGKGRVDGTFSNFKELGRGGGIGRGPLLADAKLRKWICETSKACLF